jgi:uncharacterized protein GlcG (DUF336 family)
MTPTLDQALTIAMKARPEGGKRAQAVPRVFATLPAFFPRGIVPVPGGVLLRDASRALVGVVGVTGDTSDNDEICALASIAAAWLIADTGA